MSEPVPDWVAAAALTPAELWEAAGWIASMDEEYFGLFALEDGQATALVAGLVADPDSEFGTTMFARFHGRLAGFVSAFNAEEMFARRIVVLKALLAACPDAAGARQRLRGFDGAARTVPARAFYLAKLFVAPTLRGSGLSNALLARFMQDGAAVDRKLCLHVRDDNAAALALYSKHGFTVAAEGANASRTFLLMEKEKESE